MASTSEATPSSPSETPTINNSTIPKSKFSIPNLLANFKAKFFVSKPKPLNSISANTNKNDSLSSKMIHNDLLIVDLAFAEAKKYMDQGGALFLSSNMIRNNLLLVDSAAFAEANKYMDHLEEKINKAHKKFEELQQTSGGSLEDFEELRKEVAKLRLQVCLHAKIRSADSNPHRRRWPNINEAEDGMTHFFYKEPEVTNSGDFDGQLSKAFHDLSLPWQRCLLCFFKFPPAAIIKRTTMIYLWIGQGYVSQDLTEEKEKVAVEEEAGKEIFDELIAKGFIEPIHQKASLVPDSGMMRLSVRHSLYKEAEVGGFISSNDSLDLDREFVCGGRDGDSCLVNVGEAIISYEPTTFKNMKDIRSLYLGRSQSSAMHHIELAEPKIFHGLKKLNSLSFLSLRGISMITELPEFIVELNGLEILDLRACHNLEVIPNNIGLLKRLTHLDMSECYFLEHMPESLAQLSNLQVLKGFFIGDISNERSCTLADLSSLSKLRKLNIYTGFSEFFIGHYYPLYRFEGLQKLTISWRGCLSHVDIASRLDSRSRARVRAEFCKTGERLRLLHHVQKAAFKSVEVEDFIPAKLQKLDLQCFPETTLSDFLQHLDYRNEVKKLCIRGGPLSDLCQFYGQARKVEIVRLNYLSELEIDWRELTKIFPKLIYLHQVGCPKLTNFPCDKSGVWVNMEAIDTHVQLQKYLRTNGMIISSSNSMLGSSSISAQDDCNISPVDEKPL